MPSSCCLRHPSLHQQICFLPSRERPGVMSFTMDGGGKIRASSGSLPPAPAPPSSTFPPSLSLDKPHPHPSPYATSGSSLPHQDGSVVGSDIGAAKPRRRNLPATRDRVNPTCHQCRLSKVKCDKGTPCGRCVRLKIECHPQQPDHRRTSQTTPQPHQTSAKNKAAHPISNFCLPPHYDGDSSTTSLFSSSSSVSSSSSSPSFLISSRQSSGGSTAASVDERCMELSLTSGRPVPAPAVMDVQLPRRAAAVLCSVANRMHAEGRLDPLRALSVVQMTALYSYRRNVDVTMGVADHILQLAGRRSVVMPVGPPPTMVDPNIDPGLEAAELASSFDARKLPGYLKKLCDPMAAVTGSAYFNGELHTFCNRRFADRWVAGDELDGKVRTIGVTPLLLYSKLVAPEDAMDFYTKSAEYMFSRPEERKEFCSVSRCIDKTGQEVVCLVRARHVDIEGGRCGASIVSILPLPKSRYLSEKGPARRPLLPPTFDLTVHGEDGSATYASPLAPPAVARPPRPHPAPSSTAPPPPPCPCPPRPTAATTPSEGSTVALPQLEDEEVLLLQDLANSEWNMQACSLPPPPPLAPALSVVSTRRPSPSQGPGPSTPPPVPSPWQASPPPPPTVPTEACTRREEEEEAEEDDFLEDLDELSDDAGLWEETNLLTRDL